jgi:protein-L-isoaspartate(D-aspartate) O-methyltransferase
MIDPGLIDMIMRIRGRGISDNAVLRAMELIARKRFVDEAYWEVAYEEQALPTSCGQSLSPPLTIALMTQMLELSPAHKLLEIGTGSGYHTAILSKIVKRVYSVERYKQLIRETEMRFKAMGITNHVIRHGDGRYGWGGQAPFDRIILTCALRAEPAMLIDQLAPNGKLVAVVDDQLTRYSKARKKVTVETLFPLKVPMIEAGKSKAL